MATNGNRKVTLQGRVIIVGDIVAVTGLHIGGAAGALEIGGVDSPVIRNPLNNQPYIPGSSVRGKMRSLTERLHGSEQNFQVGRTRGKEVYVHTCQADKDHIPSDKAGYEQWQKGYQNDFRKCPVCSVFGVTGDEPVSHPTSLVVRDVFLSDKSVAALEKAQTDFPYTEIKWEATIDRVTSAATPATDRAGAGGRGVRGLRAGLQHLRRGRGAALPGDAEGAATGGRGLPGRTWLAWGRQGRFPRQTDLRPQRQGIPGGSLRRAEPAA